MEFGRKEWTEFQRMYLYNSLSGTRNVVGLEQALPQPELRDILHWLLEHGSKEEVNVEDRAIKQLLRLGLVRTLDATHGRTATIVFTSPAIQQLYLRRLIGSLGTSPPPPPPTPPPQKAFLTHSQCQQNQTDWLLITYLIC